MGEQIPDLNLFMMCEACNEGAFSPMPQGLSVRSCRRDELPLWKAMPFDDPQEAEEARGFMDRFFQDVYGDQEVLFFEKCLFVCDEDDRPVGTCFLWKSYGQITTLHWFKVLKGYEGRGIGRALLTLLMRALPKGEYPVYLHTQPGSYRAIKLYSDFGFALLSDPRIGSRDNDLVACLPILKRYMPAADFAGLRMTKATEALLCAAASSQINEF